MAQRDGYDYEKASNTSEIQTKRIPAPIDINNILFHIVDKFHFNYVKIDKSIYESMDFQCKYYKFNLRLNSS